MIRDFDPYVDTERAFVDDAPTADQFCTVCGLFCDGETCECGAPLCVEHGLCDACSAAGRLDDQLERFFDELWTRRVAVQELEEAGL
jgi:hypothetical protein